MEARNSSDSISNIEECRDSLKKNKKGQRKTSVYYSLLWVGFITKVNSGRVIAR